LHEIKSETGGETEVTELKNHRFRHSANKEILLIFFYLPYTPVSHCLHMRSWRPPNNRVINIFQTLQIDIGKHPNGGATLRGLDKLSIVS